MNPDFLPTFPSGDLLGGEAESPGRGQLLGAKHQDLRATSLQGGRCSELNLGLHSSPEILSGFLSFIRQES